MRFTFCTFSYNQRELVTMQLESIKYQISRYGGEVECHFLLADDHSTDGTPEIVRAWLEENSNLFSSERIMVSSKNRGVVSNYISALKNINTDYFKILAGDDFFFKNNVFEEYRDANIVISPLVHINSEDRLIESKERLLSKAARFGGNGEGMKRFIARQYRYGGGIYAPGVFMKREVIDEGLFDALKPYKWIEDVPEWNYLFNQKTTRLRIATKPLVVYRAGIGVSQNQNEEYIKELSLLKKHIHTRGAGGNRYLSPFFYMKLLDREITTIPLLIKGDGRYTTRRLREDRKDSYENARDYIDMIIAKSNSFSKGMK